LPEVHELHALAYAAAYVPESQFKQEVETVAPTIVE